MSVRHVVALWVLLSCSAPPVDEPGPRSEAYRVGIAPQSGPISAGELRRCAPDLIKWPSSMPSGTKVLPGVVPMTLTTPRLAEADRSLTLEWDTWADEFHREMESAYAECKRTPDESCEGWELRGLCHIRGSGAVIGSICAFESFLGEARSLAVDYRTSSYVSCGGQRFMIDLQVSLCAEDEECIDRFSEAVRATLHGTERGEYDRMIEQSREPLERFSIDDGDVLLWFGDRTLSKPWSSGSRDGVNTIRLPISALGGRFEFLSRLSMGPAQSSVAPDSPSSVAPPGGGAPSSGPRVNAGIGPQDSEDDPTKKDPP